MMRLVLRFAAEFAVSFMTAVVIVAYYFFEEGSYVPDLLVMTAIITIYLIVLCKLINDIARDVVEAIQSEKRRKKIVLYKNDLAGRMVLVCYNTNMLSSKKIINKKRQTNIKLSCR